MRLRYSEIFYSLQGEGRFVGVPSVFLRTFGCNLTCRGFGQGRDPSTWLSAEQMPHMTQDLSGVGSLDDLPVLSIGCDSAASWASRYRHLARFESVDRIAERLEVLARGDGSAEDDRCRDPDRAWRLPAPPNADAPESDVHLVITGGEPMLGWQRSYPALLSHPALANLANLTFETNGTRPLSDGLRDFLLARGAAGRGPGFHLTWSVSPKLSASGEPHERAIRPEVLASYAAIPDSYLYLKFVVSDVQDFDEASEIMALYRRCGVVVDAVYAMPVGSRVEDYHHARAEVARLCMVYGFRFSPRLHVDLFGNRHGT